MKTIIRSNWTDGKGNLLFWSEQENLNPGLARCFTPDGVELKGTVAENLARVPVTAALLGELADIRDRGNSPKVANDACIEAQKGFGPHPAHLEQLRATLPKSEVIVCQPALPVTDNQLRLFYLVWVNNFCSTQGCADHYGITQDEAKVFIERGKRLHEAATNYHVLTVSSNANSFGYKSVLALNAAGLGVQLLVQAYGTDKVPVVGDVVTLGESRFFGSPTNLPATTPEKAAKIIKTLTK